MIEMLITLLVVLLILGLIYWVITLIPLPPPFVLLAQVVMAIIFVLVLISFLLPYTGHTLLR